MVRIEVSNISKSINKNVILNDVSFHSDKPEIVAIVGRNGSGKTSFLRVLIDVYKTDSGKANIFIDGKNAYKFQKQKIAIVLEQSGLYESLSVNENLNFYAELLKIKNKSEKISEVLNIVNLEKCRNELVCKLSRGQKQRISIARALLSDFELMIMDEPSVGLDSDSVNVLRKLLKKWKSENEKTILLCTHDFSIVTEICSRIILFENGRIIKDSSVDKFDMLAADGFSPDELKNNKLKTENLDLEKWCEKNVL